ncbi:hypothetical protein [uncultured Winogradskyella sp.]|uniref:hypothetical protein n=1 Tax=uncultured Winogradskyella sp. TaxID=395353 RepID=UPI0026113D16|nr:hypothetical protein [uncultured Winogradskyella sp.]
MKEFKGTKEELEHKLQFSGNRSHRRRKPQRVFSNKKGRQIVVTRFGNKFEKTEKILQRLNGKTIVHYKALGQ